MMLISLSKVFSSNLFSSRLVFFPSKAYYIVVMNEMLLERWNVVCYLIFNFVTIADVDVRFRNLWNICQHPFCFFFNFFLYCGCRHSFQKGVKRMSTSVLFFFWFFCITNATSASLKFVIFWCIADVDIHFIKVWNECRHLFY